MALTNRIPRLISVREVAERLGVSTKSVTRWIASGDLHVHHLGRTVRIAEEDVISFTAARRR